MGYESRVFVIERHEYDMPNGSKWVFGDELARFDLSKMGYEIVDNKYFSDVFKTEIDFDLHDIGEDPNAEEYNEEDYRFDRYGAHCKWATIDQVLHWLENSEVLQVEHYRRAVMLYDALKMFKAHEADFGQLVVVHYGY